MGIADYILLMLLAGIIVVLVAGIVQMFRGNNPRRSNRLMMWRVCLQALALIVVALFIARH